jgi:predicted amidophosphoribosyltransferase
MGNGKYFTGHGMCFHCHKKLKKGEAVVIFYVPYCKECAKKLLKNTEKEGFHLRRYGVGKLILVFQRSQCLLCVLELIF